MCWELLNTLSAVRILTNSKAHFHIMNSKGNTGTWFEFPVPPDGETAAYPPQQGSGYQAVRHDLQEVPLLSHASVVLWYLFLTRPLALAFVYTFTLRKVVDPKSLPTSQMAAEST